MEGWAGVVLAAGKGVRMKSRLPKVLHKVCGQELVRYPAEALRRVGVDPIVTVVSPSVAPQVRALLGKGVRYVQQGEPLGTGHALLTAQRALKSPLRHLVVMGADAPLVRPSTLEALIAHHLSTGAHLTLLSSTQCPPDGMGRVLRDAAGRVVGIVEERDVREASTPTLSGPEGPQSSEARPEEKGAVEVNAGVYCFQAGWLWEHLRQLAPGPEGEVYLTALVALAVDSGARVEGLRCEEPWEVLGVNHRVQLAQAEAVMRQRIRERWMLEGVTIVDPASTYIDASVELGQDTVIQPNTTLAGRTRVGRGCLLGPGSIIVDSTVGDRCRVVASMLEESVLEPDVDVGPFSHLRPGAHVESGVHIGNFVEVKESQLAQGVRVGHFSYIGDASIGPRANIGAGTITCNFDGVEKHRTVVEEDAFVGCDTMLVAPVKVGARAVTGAGSVVTKDVPPDTLVVGVPATTRPRRRKKA